MTMKSQAELVWNPLRTVMGCFERDVSVPPDSLGPLLTLTQTN